MSVTKKHVAPRCRVVIFSILLALLAIIAPGEALQAQQNDAALQQALAGLNVRSFKDKTAAVVALGELGDARAVVALEALTEGRLYGRKSDQTVVIADRDDRIYKLTDPGQAPLWVKSAAAISRRSSQTTSSAGLSGESSGNWRFRVRTLVCVLRLLRT